jgi:formylglycine-generating enzyme required for sulfatase activity
MKRCRQCGTELPDHARFCLNCGTTQDVAPDITLQAQVRLDGSGAIAQDGGVAAGAGGVAVGRDVYGPVVVAGEGAQVTVSLQGENVRDKELAYLNSLLAYYSHWLEHYTPLAGIAEVRTEVQRGLRLDLPLLFIPPGFEKLMERGSGEHDEIKRLPVHDLREAIAEHRRIILLGEPGSGKTTTLWRLTCDYAIAARSDGRAPLPLLAHLSEYTDPVPFDVFLARHLGPLAPYLQAYYASGRLILLLDGLNEMPQASTVERVRRIQEVLNRRPNGYVVVTCRALDYVVELKGLQKVQVSPLDHGRIRTFLHNYLGETVGEQLFWTMAGGDEVRALWDTWQQASQTDGKSSSQTWSEFWTATQVPATVPIKTTAAQDELWLRLRREPPVLLALSRNPYMLLMTAQIYASGQGQLPTNRARLFATFIDTLLERERKRTSSQWIEAEEQKDALAALAYAMLSEHGRGTTVEREWAVSWLRQASPGRDPERLLYLASNATLLDTTQTTVRFYHQLLQEYLAAREMGKRLSAGQPPTDYWPPSTWWKLSGWEETVFLLAGLEPDASMLVDQLNTASPVVAARCVAEGEASVSERVRRGIISALISKMTDETQPPIACVRSGDALGQVGDPRFRSDAWFLPDEPLLGFVEIPAGPFVMGSDPQRDAAAQQEERPQHELILPAYYIARYPVTVAQFSAFVQDSRYAPTHEHCLQGLLNHPVTLVTWLDALAYSRWLTDKLCGWTDTPQFLATLLQSNNKGSTWAVMLPSEAEWEKAARGSDGRIYPWGDEFEPNRANLAEAGIGSISPVGCFPSGASPYGVMELCGNVWEWTRTLWDRNWGQLVFRYPYNPTDGREVLQTQPGDHRVLRGGASRYHSTDARCASRERYNPEEIRRSFGFRVVVSPL